MLRNLIDRIKPTFEKGGRLSMFHSTFDAFETFLFVPKTTTRLGAHIRDSIDSKRAMIIVVLALVPCLLFGMYNTGYQHFLSLGALPGFWEMFFYGFLKIVPTIIVSYVVGLGIEFAVAQMRGHEVNEGFLVSGFLIPLVCPPDIPLWMVAVATAFAVIIGKEVFGGTGMNIWNPALICRAFLFFAFPAQMSGDKVWIAEKLDAFSGATPLADLANGQATALSPMDMFLGFMPGSVGETSKVAIIIGAIILLWTGIASFRVMFSVIVGGLGMGLIFNWLGAPDNVYAQMPAYHHLLVGGFLFGAVFMATDPVTASQTGRGKWIYGLLIGVMAVIIRVLNPAYPEGMMLSILLLNTFAPTIDHFVVEANKKRRLKRAQIALKIHQTK